MKRMMAGLLALVILGGCASSREAELERKVTELEAKVEQLSRNQPALDAKTEDLTTEQRENLAAERDFQAPVDATATRERDIPDPETAPASKAEYSYVASARSDKFHIPSCSSAGRINPENLVFYKSRGDAEGDGKEPCRRCSP